MKHFMIILSSLIAFCCTTETSFVSYSEADFEALLQNNDSVQLVDVRRPSEYEAGHIENAILIDMTDTDFLAKADSLLDKSRPVAVYCRSGRRSRKAARRLVKNGYTVYNLNNGYKGWQRYQEEKNNAARK